MKIWLKRAFIALVQITPLLFAASSEGLKATVFCSSNAFGHQPVCPKELLK